MKIAEEPFRHCTLDDHWDPKLLEKVFDEFPLPSDSRWIIYDNEHEGKYHGDTPVWGSRTLELLENFRKFTPDLSELFGISGLVMETVGGGMHLIPPGGRLDIHTDFNRSPDSGLYRRLNLMCYLNRGWGDPGGLLELWPDVDPTRREDGEEVPDDVVRYAPEFNRTVIFESSDISWHGHPVPAKRWRLSIAAYYFSPDPPEGYAEEHSTVWRFP